ncbi:TPA: ead/Ea22-like family protein [Klebsiella oxytoca]
MTDITEMAQSLKAAAEKATPGQWRRASTQFNGITATPFMLGRKEAMIAGVSEKRDAEFIAMANPANVLALVEALEKAQSKADVYDMLRDDYGLREKGVGLADFVDWQAKRIAELEREQEHLRPVGVMSEKAFHRLENRECRFIALWPRPGIFLPRKRPEDGVIVYARTAAAAGIKVEAE